MTLIEQHNNNICATTFSFIFLWSNFVHQYKQLVRKILQLLNGYLWFNTTKNVPKFNTKIKVKKMYIWLKIKKHVFVTRQGLQKIP